MSPLGDMSPKLKTVVIDQFRKYDDLKNLTVSQATLATPLDPPLEIKTVIVSKPSVSNSALIM
jgi:hypothetical protein